MSKSCCNTDQDETKGKAITFFMPTLRDIARFFVPIEFIGRSLTNDERNDLLQLGSTHKDVPRHELIPQ